VPIRPAKLLPWLLIPVIVCGYITVSGLTGFCPTCKLIVDRIRGRSAPPPAEPEAATSLTAFDLDGHELPVSLRSDVPTILDLWSTRCPPCIEQRRVLADLAREQGPRVRIISISVDRDIRDVLKFVADHPGPGQELIAGPDTTASLLQSAGAPPTTAASLELPTLFLIDTRGRIQPPRSGLQSLDALRAALQIAP
jgi:thiol-disulfide isomerase/thioredoxin